MNDIEKRIEEAIYKHLRWNASSYSVSRDVKDFTTALTTLYHQLLLEDREKILKILDRIETGDIQTVVSYEEDTWRWWKSVRNTITDLTTLNKEKD